MRASFAKIRSGLSLSPGEINGLKSALLVFLAEMDHAKGWTQQFHLGALRNNNSRLLRQLGPDTGWVSIRDFSQAQSLSRFMRGLDDPVKQTKLILCNLDLSANHVTPTLPATSIHFTIPV